jgi:mRNA export factor
MTINFNFKCHRVEDKQGQQTVVNSFPCNGVAFNNKFNTMATCGSDGTYVFWDKDNRQKLKAYPDQPQQPSRAGAKAPPPATFGNSIIDIDFSPDSSFVAYAVAYDWAKGADGRTNTNEGLYVKRVTDQEIGPKRQEQKNAGFQSGYGNGQRYGR